MNNTFQKKIIDIIDNGYIPKQPISIHKIEDVPKKQTIYNIAYDTDDLHITLIKSETGEIKITDGYLDNLAMIYEEIKGQYINEHT